MNLILNNVIAEHKDAETTMVYTHVLKKAKGYQESGGGDLSPANL